VTIDPVRGSLSSLKLPTPGGYRWIVYSFDSVSVVIDIDIDFLCMACYLLEGVCWRRHRKTRSSATAEK